MPSRSRSRSEASMALITLLRIRKTPRKTATTLTSSRPTNLNGCCLLKDETDMSITSFRDKVIATREACDALPELMPEDAQLLFTRTAGRLWNVPDGYHWLRTNADSRAAFRLG